MFNGSNEVEIDGYGNGYSEITRALRTTATTPTFGQFWGPLRIGQWTQRERLAVLVYGDIETDLLFGMVLKGVPVRVKGKTR